MYDLIGDIHGYATPLTNLLTKLGYHEHGGLWRHRERKVIFLGDFIDRGPEQVETVRIARTMVEAGEALSIMGNHEFNAVSWAMTDPDSPDSYLRPHTEKNRKQHQQFLTAVGEDSSEHEAIIEWFKTLPVYLDLPGLRVVHACWHAASMVALHSCLDDQNRVGEEAWPALNHKGTEAYDAAEILLKGLEIALPAGFEFPDKDENLRSQIRTRWWETGHLTYRDLAMVPREVIDSIPHTPIPADILPGYEGDKPLFVGHYWLTGEPVPLTPHIACLDYSIAGSHTGTGAAGKLCAYRWDGEGELSAKKFVWVDN